MRLAISMVMFSLVASVFYVLALGTLYMPNDPPFDLDLKLDRLHVAGASCRRPPVDMYRLNVGLDSGQPAPGLQLGAAA